MTIKVTERVPFRLLHQARCCGTLLCWVNPRLPNYCPECGVRCYPLVKENILIVDDEALLKVDEGVVMALATARSSAAP